MTDRSNPIEFARLRRQMADENERLMWQLKEPNNTTVQETTGWDNKELKSYDLFAHKSNTKPIRC